MVADLLSQTLRGPCLQMLMNVESLNGLEARRIPVRREEGSAQVAQLTSILRFTFSVHVEQFAEELTTFQGAVQRYEAQHNELIPDAIHQAILKANASNEIRSQVELTTFATSEKLGEAHAGYATTRLTMHAMNPPGLAAGTPHNPQCQSMDISYVGGKGGKKGKGGKGGNSKGKGGNNKDNKGR